MAIVCAILAAVLAFVAIKHWRDERALAAFFLAGALLNGAASAHMLAASYEYRWVIGPNIDAPDPGYHHRR